MRQIKIQVPGSQDFIIGDVWVNVDIEFKPSMYSDRMTHSIAIDAFNARLDLIAGKMQMEIKKSINEKLDSLKEDPDNKAEREFEEKVLERDPREGVGGNGPYS